MSKSGKAQGIPPAVLAESLDFAWFAVVSVLSFLRVFL
jgi:hypothetical protein